MNIVEIQKLIFRMGGVSAHTLLGSWTPIVKISFDIF